MGLKNRLKQGVSRLGNKLDDLLTAGFEGFANTQKNQSPGSAHDPLFVNYLDSLYKSLFNPSHRNTVGEVPIDNIMKDRFGPNSLYETEKDVLFTSFIIEMDDKVNPAKEIPRHFTLTYHKDGPKQFSPESTERLEEKAINPLKSIVLSFVNLYSPEGTIKSDIRDGFYRLLNSVNTQEGDASVGGYQNFDSHKFDYLDRPDQHEPYEVSKLVVLNDRPAAILQGKTLTARNIDDVLANYKNRQEIKEKLGITGHEEGKELDRKYYLFSDLIISPEFEGMGLGSLIEDLVFKMIKDERYDGVIAEEFIEPEVIQESDGRYCSVPHIVVSKVASKHETDEEYLGTSTNPRTCGGEYDLNLYAWDFRNAQEIRKTG
ncbi:MAG: hypothetical protein ABIJ08_04585 [Nanoarchaeota archaeon]